MAGVLRLRVSVDGSSGSSSESSMAVSNRPRGSRLSWLLSWLLSLTGVVMAVSTDSERLLALLCLLLLVVEVAISRDSISSSSSLKGVGSRDWRRCSIRPSSLAESSSMPMRAMSPLSMSVV